MNNFLRDGGANMLRWIDIICKQICPQSVKLLIVLVRKTIVLDCRFLLVFAWGEWVQIESITARCVRLQKILVSKPNSHLTGATCGWLIVLANWQIAWSIDCLHIVRLHSRHHNDTSMVAVISLILFDSSFSYTLSLLMTWLRNILHCQIKMSISSPRHTKLKLNCQNVCQFVIPKSRYPKSKKSKWLILK